MKVGEDIKIWNTCSAISSERASEEVFNDRQDLAEFFRLLLRIDQRENPQLYLSNKNKYQESSGSPKCSHLSLNSTIERAKNAPGKVFISISTNDILDPKINQGG